MATVVAWAVAVIYMAATLAYPVPRLRPVVAPLVEPQFTQQWRLFGPSPVLGDVDWFLRVRFAGAQPRESGEIDLTEADLAYNKSHRYAPSKLYLESVTDYRRLPQGAPMYQRIGSAAADRFFPGTRVSAVRMAVRERDLPLPGQPAPGWQQIHDYGWQDYVPGVGRP